MGKFIRHVTPIVEIELTSRADQGRARRDLDEALRTLRFTVPKLLDVDCEIGWRFVTDAVCEHCSYAWTEKSDSFNGGCCDKDMENEPKEQAA